MEMDFAFAVVPFARNGRMEDLFVPGTDYGEMHEGVELLDTEREDEIPSPGGLCLSGRENEELDRETGGFFRLFISGPEASRYVILGPRRAILEALKRKMPGLSTEFRKRFLEVLIYNAERYLDEYGSRAALLIYYY